MTDAKTCINDAQEKMDMAVLYLEEAISVPEKPAPDCLMVFVLILTGAWCPSAT